MFTAEILHTSLANLNLLIGVVYSGPSTAVNRRVHRTGRAGNAGSWNQALHSAVGCSELNSISLVMIQKRIQGSH